MEKVIQDTLDILDNWSNRLEGHCSQKRSAKRTKYRQLINIYVPNNEASAGEEDDFGMTVVVSRNLSRTGVSFLHSKILPADKIVVALSQDKENCVYMEGIITRRRQVHNDLWEFGVQFIGRTEM